MRAKPGAHRGLTEEDPPPEPDDHLRVDVVDLSPVANLGAQFLRQYTVTFDLANHRMALAR